MEKVDPLRADGFFSLSSEFEWDGGDVGTMFEPLVNHATTDKPGAVVYFYSHNIPLCNSSTIDLSPPFKNSSTIPLPIAFLLISI